MGMITMRPAGVVIHSFEPTAVRPEAVNSPVRTLLTIPPVSGSIARTRTVRRPRCWVSIQSRSSASAIGPG